MVAAQDLDVLFHCGVQVALIVAAMRIHPDFKVLEKACLGLLLLFLFILFDEFIHSNLRQSVHFGRQVLLHGNPGKVRHVLLQVLLEVPLSHLVRVDGRRPFAPGPQGRQVRLPDLILAVVD